MNKDVDKFLKNLKQWREETKKLRAILLQTKLDEDFKWRLPCYTSNGANVVIIQPFKNYLGLMFFKGALLKDKKGLLVNNGPNSQAPRRFEFRSLQEVTKQAAAIKAYIKEAIAIEESGQKIKIQRKPEPLPAELKKIFTQKPALKKAFTSLTPGRQRAYILHFSSAKQSATRRARIEKCIPQILAGKGMNDR